MWSFKRLKSKPPASSPGADEAPVATEDPAALASIEHAIRAFLAGYSRQWRGAPHALPAHRNLWREVDSLTMLQLVAFVEQKFSIKVRPIDFAPQHFSTISAIARLVAARRPRPGGS